METTSQRCVRRSFLPGRRSQPCCGQRPGRHGLLARSGEVGLLRATLCSTRRVVSCPAHLEVPSAPSRDAAPWCGCVWALCHSPAAAGTPSPADDTRRALPGVTTSQVCICCQLAEGCNMRQPRPSGCSCNGCGVQRLFQRLLALPQPGCLWSVRCLHRRRCRCCRGRLSAGWAQRAHTSFSRASEVLTPTQLAAWLQRLRFHGGRLCTWMPAAWLRRRPPGGSRLPRGAPPGSCRAGRLQGLA